MTGSPINLNRARKARARAEARWRADANAVKFGRSKAERLLAAAQNEKAHRMLDLHQCEDVADDDKND